MTPQPVVATSSAGAPASVTFDGVTKVYDGGTRAVNDLSLEVGDGEFIVLVGPSGCGKTTALRMVAGLEEITDGRDPDRRHGRQRRRPAQARRRDGLPELRALPAHDASSTTSRFGLRCAARRRSARSGGASSEIGARARARASCSSASRAQLSGGQRQRVAMGRAIVREPQVFLMDEPLSNLDAKLRVQMRAEIARIQRELGATTIYVTHDQVEAMTMGDRVAVMREGRAPADRRRRRSLRPAGEPLRRELHRQPADEPRPGAARARDGGLVLRRRRAGAALSRPSSSRARPALAATRGRDGRRSGSGPSTCAMRRRRRRPSGAAARRACGRPRRSARSCSSTRLDGRAGADRGGARGRGRRRRCRARPARVARRASGGRSSIGTLRDADAPVGRRRDRGRGRPAQAALLRPRERARDLP